MKSLLLAPVIGLGIAAVLVSPKSLVDNHVAKLKEAKSLTATFSVRPVPGSPKNYTLTYSKPNLLLIDGPERTVETDGVKVWEYNKADKTYTESAFASDAFSKRIQGDEIWAWAAFFTEEGLKGLTDLKQGSTRNVKGNSVTEVSFALGTPATKTGTIFFDDKLGIARGLSLRGANGEILVMADQLTLGKDSIPAEKFVFNAPADAKKVEPAAVTTSGENIPYASVQPILENNCIGCHNSSSAKGRFSVSSYREVVAGGRSGAAVIPGNPDGSPLVKYLTGELKPRMPRNASPLPDSDIEKIKAWIKAGAKS